jgi:alkanesulfonate monooxygenase SsuD/methylene tetrahydromethanopterin reductase-like flavin-dependent oxidoreductase (luciferase family)
MWWVRWTLERMKPEFDAALADAGRSRSAVEVNLWPWVAPGGDVRQALDDARPTMAFYGGIEQYEPFFEAHGFGDVARRLQAGVQGGNYLDVAALVPDEMVRTFVAVGTPDEVRARIEPLWGFADSLCPLPPVYGLAFDKVAGYHAAIARTFGGGS